jgi:hypothetical protein
MKTKKDFWKTIIYAYLAIFSGIIILLASPGDSKTQIYFLLAVILLEVLGIIIIQKALKIYRSLDDKSIYPKQLDFLNRLATKLYSDKKTSNIVMIVALLIGGFIGVIIGLYYL